MTATQCDFTSEKFLELVELVKTGDIYTKKTGDDAIYQQFIEKYPANTLTDLSIDQYCLGQNSIQGNFCWWLERGLQDVLGRYMPGTSRGHLLYKDKNGEIYRHRRFVELSPEAALSYTLKVHAAIAQSDSNDDLTWIDNDDELYRRAGVEPLQTMGKGRKLRLLSAYHPDSVLPIASADHVGHFLKILGTGDEHIPEKDRPIARMLLLKEYYLKAKELMPELTTFGFMKALYSQELGIRPVRDKTVTPDNDSEIDEYTEQTDPELPASLNQVLYGPPGTGKTYFTRAMAVKIADPDWYEEQYDELEWQPFHQAVKERYKALVDEGRIDFVTFHQSFSYEEFVEGIRAIEESGSLNYRVEPGIFKKMCRKAENRLVGAVSAGIGDQARVWKISIDGTGHSQTRDYCLKNSEMRIGWGHVGDLGQDDRSEEELQAFESEGSNNQSTLMAFAEDAQVGDMVLCISSRESIQAVGVIASDYSYLDSSEPCGEGYNHRRAVNWLVDNVDIPFMDLNGGKGFTLKTFYELWRLSPAKVLKRLEEHGHHILEKESEDSSTQKPVVLIIDEINRDNISKVFGELITLLEPSKRAGRSEELSVSLPYSQERLSVPDNLYIIGTMNTADRSLAMMDTALRRRFDFIEMMPDYRLLSETIVDGLNIRRMLEVMNRRIEFLYDREHMLGHAFFMPLNDVADNERLDLLGSIFSNKIIPLLEEYFYEDWGKIRLVLGDNQTNIPEEQFILKDDAVSGVSLFGDSYQEDFSSGNNIVYKRNADALDNIKAYQKIINTAGGK